MSGSSEHFVDQYVGDGIHMTDHGTRTKARHIFTGIVENKLVE